MSVAFVSADGVVYIGGGFGWISGEMHPYLAAITDLDQLVGAPPVGTRTSASLLPDGGPQSLTRSASTVRFLLPRAGRASLVLLDLAGRRVRTLVDRADADRRPTRVRAAARWSRGGDLLARAGCRREHRAAQDRHPAVNRRDLRERSRKASNRRCGASVVSDRELSRLAHSQSSQQRAS